MNATQESALEALILENRADYEEAIKVSLGDDFNQLTKNQITALTNLMQATVKLSVMTANAML